MRRGIRFIRLRNKKGDLKWDFIIALVLAVFVLFIVSVILFGPTGLFEKAADAVKKILDPSKWFEGFG